MHCRIIETLAMSRTYDSILMLPTLAVRVIMYINIYYSFTVGKLSHVDIPDMIYELHSSASDVLCHIRIQIIYVE